MSQYDLNFKRPERAGMRFSTCPAILRKRWIRLDPNGRPPIHDNQDVPFEIMDVFVTFRLE